MSAPDRPQAVNLAAGWAPDSWQARPSAQMHLALVAFCYFGAFAIRRMKPSSRVLDWADAIATVTVCIGWAAMILMEDGMISARDSRGEMIVLLASSFTLATRAALLPSTTLRTFVLSTLGLVPVVPLTISIYANDASAKAWPIGPAIYAGTWAALGIVCAPLALLAVAMQFGV